MLIPLDQMIACVSRELTMRKRVYHSLVNDGRMSQEKSENEIETMQAVLDLLNEKKRATEPEFSFDGPTQT